jgi:hypothetical protein
MEYKGTQRSERNARKLFLFLQTNHDWMQDVPVDQGQCPTWYPVHGQNLRTRLLRTVLHLPLVEGQGQRAEGTR